MTPTDASALRRILGEQPLHRFDRESIESELGDRIVVGPYRLKVTKGGSYTDSTAHVDLKAELLSRLDGTYTAPHGGQGPYYWWCYLPSDEMNK